jgi:hypothetical protein
MFEAWARVKRCVGRRARRRAEAAADERDQELWRLVAEESDQVEALIGRVVRRVERELRHALSTEPRASSDRR